MSMIRDFLRWRRVRKHVALHGWRFDFHGVEVRLPVMDQPGFANALLRGKYEAEEAALILSHLPPDAPVIELGGSLGIVSALIGSRLGTGLAHVIVEANEALLPVCSVNAGVGLRAGVALRHAAVFYGGPVARFAAGGNIHANRLAEGDAVGVIEVPAVTLAELWQGIDRPDGFSLVCDIEGGEVPLVLGEGDVLAHAGVVIMELHPAVYPDGEATVDAIGAAMREAGLRQVARLRDVVLWVRD